MRTLFLLLMVAFALVACQTQKPIDGLWISAYTYIPDADTTVLPFKKELLLNSQLLSFHGNQLKIIRLGDKDIRAYEAIQIDTHAYALEYSSLRWDTNAVPIQFNSDSLVLHYENPTREIVFRKVPEKYQQVKIDSKVFRGAYKINYSPTVFDSLHFINDSMMLFTGSSFSNRPAFHWSILQVEEYSFLNIHSPFHTPLLITPMEHDTINLIYFGKTKQSAALKPIQGVREKTDFLGLWKEKGYETMVGPPIITDVEWSPFTLDIRIDKLVVCDGFGVFNSTWELSGAGNRIFLQEQIFDRNGTFLIESLTDSSMVVRPSSGTLFDRETIPLVKVE